MADETGSAAGDAIDLTAASQPPRQPRRRALWGVLVVVTMAAFALAISAGGSDDEGLPLLPAGVGGAARAEGAMAADSSMVAWVHYVAGDALPALGGDAAAYRLSGSVDDGRVRALAEVLGVEGPIEDTGDGWLVTDGRATLEVVDDGGAAWWYSTLPPDAGASAGSGSAGCEPTGDGGCVTPDCEPGAATDCTFTEVGEAIPTTTAVLCDGSPDADCVEPVPAQKACPPDGICTEPGPDGECVANQDCTLPEPAPMPIEPPPAADLPSEDEARAIALDLLTATGVGVDDARVTVDGPYDAWYVSLEHTIDGVPVSGWHSTVAVGPHGEVLHANGMLAQAERLGDYPLIDTSAAIDRLNEQQAVAFDGGWSPYPGIAQDTATADAAASAPVTSLLPPCDPQLSPEEMDRCLAEGGYAIPTTSVPSTQLAPMPAPEPEPADVVLTTAEPVLVLTVGPEGAYLVPGYRFGNADGMQVDASAVADDHLAPTTTVPPTEVPDPPVTEPAPGECEVLVEDDGSGTTHTVNPCTTTTTIAGSEPRPLEPGETPAVGVPYYVDVDLTCVEGSFLLGDQLFVLEDGDTTGWSTPHEGGMFTLDSPSHGTFQGGADDTKTATFRALGPDEDLFCSPQPRR